MLLVFILYSTHNTVYMRILHTIVHRDAFMVTSPGSSFSHTGHANYHSNLRSSSSSDPLQLQIQLQPNTSTTSTSSSWDVMCANGFILHGVYRDVYAFRSRYVATIADFINYILYQLYTLSIIYTVVTWFTHRILILTCAYQQCIHYLIIPSPLSYTLHIRRGVDTNHHWAGDDGADYNLSMADRHTRRIRLHVRLSISTHIHYRAHAYTFIAYAYTYLCHMY